ncbi:MAG: retroviral-like aspartic protease family protein [Caldilineaceae bacterium]|nr:retroviral-like aspartic protease family protein [Caldilineaceae bacterium]
MTVSALIDSGADGTVLPLDLLTRIGAPHVDTRMLRTITGARIAVSLFRITLHIGDYTLRNLRVVGHASSAEAILGRDALNQLIVTMNGLASTTEISQ